MPSQGDIVLIPVPFTDLTSQKRRPVVVISNNEYNRTVPDVVVVAMTSQPPSGSYSFAITDSDLASGTLNRPSTIRVDKVYTLRNRSSSEFSAASMSRPWISSARNLRR